MAEADLHRSGPADQGKSGSAAVAPGEPQAKADKTAHIAQVETPTNDAAQAPGSTPVRRSSRRKWFFWIGGIAGVCAGAYFLVPWMVLMLNTVSTDDAYVNGHVTFVAARVPGQVSEVLVDDNMRVKSGDVLVRLDKEPYQVIVDIKKPVVSAAETDLAAARAGVIALEAKARSQRWQLQRAMEDVDNQVANLYANVAAYESKKATLALSRANLKRAEGLLPSDSIAKEEYDQRLQTFKADEAAVKQALEVIRANRVALGLAAQPSKGHELTEVPPDLNQNFSAVRTALASLVQTMAQVGLPLTASEASPRAVLEAFRQRDPKEDVDRVLASLVPNAPAVKQAEAKLLQARRDLAQALLDLRYTDVISEIDGVVTRRNVNPGNNITAGQSLMAVRSITEIWIDANFKETQLANLRIGQRARLEVDMYGSRKEFEGRITGFTMGTGQTLALLPPQNATGNFVKIVQRLPVRIELTNYNPNQETLFVGLSCTPYVYYKEPPQGPHAGEFLQPLAPLPTGPTEPRP
jgi:membrane fusion protein (multidrug efflux system)